MSKRSLIFCISFAVGLLLLVTPFVTEAQAVQAVITVSEKSTTASVEGRFLSGSPASNLLFLRYVAGFSLLGRRSELELFDRQGSPLTFKTLMPEEHLAAREVYAFRFLIDLALSETRSMQAHASWLTERSGMLMLDDLLPLLGRNEDKSAKVTLRLPQGWTVTSTEKEVTAGVYEVRDLERAIFVVGTDWSETRAKGSPALRLTMQGTRQTRADEAVQMASEICSEYTRSIGSNSKDVLVAIGTFRIPLPAGTWQAETRGSNVTIISSDMPFRSQSLQRLHEQLRHELFHLWIPNGVNLSGNYDWFYEGFALYESLKLAVAVNRIRFDDFLDTLSRAHTIDSAQSQRISLIQASRDRFSGANTQVYARGMLVAFLCDLALLDHSKGKRSVENILAELFANHRMPAEPVDGNTAVLALLKGNPNVSPVVNRYVTGADKIDWANDLAGAGIEDSDAGPLTTLRVKEKLNGRQKTLLDKLGYNNWRKLSPTSK